MSGRMGYSSRTEVKVSTLAACSAVECVTCQTRGSGLRHVYEINVSIGLPKKFFYFFLLLILRIGYFLLPDDDVCLLVLRVDCRYRDEVGYSQVSLPSWEL